MKVGIFKRDELYYAKVFHDDEHPGLGMKIIKGSHMALFGSLPVVIEVVPNYSGWTVKLYVYSPINRRIECMCATIEGHTGEQAFETSAPLRDQISLT